MEEEEEEEHDDEDVDTKVGDKKDAADVSLWLSSGS